jgi:hypothetical protein
LLHSIPRQELGMEALRESELNLLEWRMRVFSIGKWSDQELRAIGGGDVYIGLSQEFSHWAKIQNPEGVGQCLARTLYVLGALLGRAGHCLTRVFYLWMDLKKTWNR